MKPVQFDHSVVAEFPSELFFLRDDKGEVFSLKWRRNGHLYCGLRRPLSVLSKEVELNKARLSSPLDDTH